MKRIYAFAIGLAMSVTPVVAATDLGSGVAAADPSARSMDYQQVADVVVARGLSQRGVPFSWAGGGVNGPSRGTGTGAMTVGFDASGLMQYAYAGAGIKLPRSSGQLYRVGQKVLPQQARKGDLIFYGPEGTQSVAMYLGNGQMLEVGDVVQVSPVRSSGMTPYLVRVLGAPTTPCTAGTDAADAGAAGTGSASATAVGTRPAGTGAAVGTRSAGTGAAVGTGQQAPAQQSPLQLVPTQQAPAQGAPTPQAPLQLVPAQPAAPLQPATVPATR